MPEREMITCKLKIQCLYRATKCTATRSSPASRTRDHLLSSQIPLDRTSLPHTGSRSCLVLKENPSPFLYVMRWTWACDVLKWSSLAAPAPCSQTLQTGDQGYSPVGRGAHSQESSGEQSVWPGLHPGMWSCSHHSPRGARNTYTLYV